MYPENSEQSTVTRVVILMCNPYIQSSIFHSYIFPIEIIYLLTCWNKPHIGPRNHDWIAWYPYPNKSSDFNDLPFLTHCYPFQCVEENMSRFQHHSKIYKLKMFKNPYRIWWLVGSHSDINLSILDFVECYLQSMSHFLWVFELCLYLSNLGL